MTGKFVLVDKNTFFKGTIIAEKVIVEGSVEGEINASEHVLLKKGSVVNGPIQTPRFFCEEGSNHNGLIRLDAAVGNENEDNSISSVPQIEDEIEEQKKEEKPSSSASTKKEKSSKRLW